MTNRHPGIYLFATIPLFLKGFINIHVSSPSCWLACDYGIRILTLTILWMAVRKSYVSLPDLGLISLPRKELIYQITLAIVLIQGMRYILAPFLYQYLPNTPPLATYPLVPGTPIYIFDLAFGIPLVVLSEEVVFRGLLLLTALKKSGALASIFLSAALFAAIHWSWSLPTIIAAFLTGMIIGWITWQTKSILPALIEHYLHDLLIFSKPLL